MKTQRFWTSALVGGCLLGTMLTVAPAVSTAEAGKPRIQRTERPRVERREARHRTVRNHRRHAVVRHHRRTAVVYRHRRPAVWRVHAPVRVVYRRPAWCDGARTVLVDRDPFYFHAGLGLYFGGLNLNLELGDYAPMGYAYFDPYCGEEFYSIVAYRRHLHRHQHTAALRVVWIGD
jgi:hypothetical protein